MGYGPYAQQAAPSHRFPIMEHPAAERADLQEDQLEVHGATWGAAATPRDEADAADKLDRSPAKDKQPATPQEGDALLPSKPAAAGPTPSAGPCPAA